MQIELPAEVESLAREKAARAGFDDVGEYVVSLLLHEEVKPDAGQSDDAAGKERSAVPTDWSDEKNARRCELIDKDIQGAISEAEREELASLTRQFREYRRRHAPLPLEGALRLHGALLERKRRAEQNGES